MTESQAHPAAGPVLRVHGPSRIAFAGTTLALVTLASLATATLVKEGTSVPPASRGPQLQALPPLVTGGGNGIVVDRAPGTWAPARRIVLAPAVVDALVGNAGSDRVPVTVIVNPPSFTGTGVLPGTTTTPVTVPVAPVVDPVAPATVPAQPEPPVLPHIPKVSHPHLPTPHVVEAVARAARKVHHKPEHKAGHKPEHKAHGHDDRDQVEDIRFHEQARHAKAAKAHGKHKHTK